MARRGRSIPRPLRTFAGGAVLVVTVRVLDAVWRRSTGRPTPVEARTIEDDARAVDPDVVRDRLVYALLLGGALRIARRIGLPKGSEQHARGDGRSKRKGPA
jgi:hypothetical protein